MTLLPLPRHIVEDAVRRALAEDLGGAGDITSLATLPGDAEGIDPDALDTAIRS